MTLIGKNPKSNLGQVAKGKIATSTARAEAELRRMHPDHDGSLGFARVVHINPEDKTISLRILSGSAGDKPRAPVPITWPSAGSRHVLGVMPGVGDYCIVGWVGQSSGSKKVDPIPIVLRWVLSSTWGGREWTTGAGFTHDELDVSSPKMRELLSAEDNRTRFKLRHMEPGNLVGSSAQGSDLVLDEGVLLSNRRGNELRLRDQDQALVVRSLQQFHATAGVRVYTGMVQRDASVLPSAMVSDGKEWDGKTQSLLGEPVHEDDLPNSVEPEGHLTPARILGKMADDDGVLGRALFQLDDNLDPFAFLRRGGFIDSSGQAIRDLSPDAMYGGKPIFRVSTSADNATLAPDAPTFTEWRMEVSHTSDGRLPVTEQTDLFDAERLPTGDLDTPGPSPNLPFIEQAYGTVVGNDPHSQMGQEQYGFPLVPYIFQGSRPSPRLDKANTSGANPTPIGEQAATLFKLRPPLDPTLPVTFWSVNKKGQVRMALSGPSTENSVEAAIRGGLRMSIGGKFDLQMDGSIRFRSKSSTSRGVGLEMAAEEGAVSIFGGRPRTDIVDDGSPAPAVDIEGRGNVWVRAGEQALVDGSVVLVRGGSVELRGLQDVQVSTAGKLGVSAGSVNFTSTGQTSETFTGPASGLPSSGALHVKAYSPTIPGHLCEETTYRGDRKETFEFGNHETKVVVGDMTYDLEAGTFQVDAGPNMFQVGTSDGIEGDVAAGSVSLQAVAGEASFVGQTGVFVESTGTVEVRSKSYLYLGAPITGTNMGPIICAGSLEPLTGLPFATWGLGASNHWAGS